MPDARCLSANPEHGRDQRLCELVDAEDRVRARYDYGLWGERHKLVGDLETSAGYTGHYYHAPSALHLAPYRAYSADLGRWLSRDPIEEGGGTNLHRYVRNSPVTRVLHGRLVSFARSKALLSMQTLMLGRSELRAIGVFQVVHSTRLPFPPAAVVERVSPV
jgi:RHS repeat-associated protein